MDTEWKNQKLVTTNCKYLPAILVAQCFNSSVLIVRVSKYEEGSLSSSFYTETDEESTFS